MMMKFSELSDEELIACWTLAVLWRRSNGRHLRYFSVEIIRHHDQGNNKTWHLIWDPQFQRLEFMTVIVGLSSRHRAGTVAKSVHLNP